MGLKMQLQKRVELVSKLESAIAQGKIKLTEGISIDARKMTMDYAIETEFLPKDSSPTEDIQLQARFFYGAVKKNGEVINSFWISPETKPGNYEEDEVLGGRPDYLWLPPDLSTDYDSTHPFADFMALLSPRRAGSDPNRTRSLPSERCQNLSIFIAVDRFLERTPNPREIEPEVKDTFLKQLKQVQMYLELPEIKKMVEASNISNLSWQEVQDEFRK